MASQESMPNKDNFIRANSFETNSFFLKFFLYSISRILFKQKFFFTFLHTVDKHMKNMKIVKKRIIELTRLVCFRCLKI